MKILFVLFLTTLSFGQLLPPNEEMAKMSTYEKQMLYEKKNKNVYWNLYAQLNVPTLGYARINKWNRGLKFLGAQILSSAIGIYIYESAEWNSEQIYESDGDYYWYNETCDNECEMRENFGFFLIYTGIGLKIYEFIDLYKETNKYNKQLHNKIFGKKGNDFSFLILPTSNGAYLNISYKF